LALYAFENFVLDTQLYELRGAGNVVPMEPQVFDVLLYLVTHHEQVVTKDELMENVWGDKYISEAALNSRIMSARKAIGDSGREQRLIRTVHGRGYHFVARVETEAEATTAAKEPSHPQRATSLEARAEDDAPVMLGREQDLTFLQEKLNSSRQGKRQIVLLTGDAGLGKTTLLNAFLRGVDNDVNVGRGQCLEHRGEGEPYMPLLEALGRVCEAPGGHEVLEGMARLAPTWLAQMPRLVDEEAWPMLQQRLAGANRDRMLREIVECIDSVTAETTLILALEDMHWSDHSTLDVLDMLARRTDPARLMVIATYRPTDVSAQQHPLYAMARELILRGYATELRLTSLSNEAAGEFAESRLGNSLPPATVSALLERTGGNPLYMEMVLDALRAENQEGEPLLELPEAIPESLREYIEQRLALLHEEERTILEAASVVGASFAIGALEPATSFDGDVIEKHANAMARSGKFIQARDPVTWPDGTVSDTFAFLHDLYQEVLYQGISAARRVRLHRLVGDRLEEAYGSFVSEHAAELALHFVRGNVDLKAIHYLRLAGEQAIGRSADQEAADHLGQALDLVLRQPPSRERDQQEAGLSLELASALVPRRGWADSQVERCFVRGLELAEAIGDEEYVSAALFGNAVMREVRGEYNLAAELLGRRMLILEKTPPDAGAVAPLESCEILACSEFHRGLFSDALEHAERGLTLFEPEIYGGFTTIGESPGISCYDWSGLSSWFLGYPDQAGSRILEALALTDQPANQYSRTVARTQAAILYQLRGDVPRALEMAEAAIESANEFGYAFRAAWAGILVGWARAMQGDPEGGIAEIREGMEVSLQSGARMDHAYYQALLADALRIAGDLDGALKELDAALEAIRSERTFFYEAEMLRLKGRLLLQRDGEEGARQARECFEEALRVARDQGAKPLQLRAAIEMVRVASTPEEKTAAREVLHELVDWYQPGTDMPELKEAHALLS